GDRTWRPTPAASAPSRPGAHRGRDAHLPPHRRRIATNNEAMPDAPRNKPATSQAAERPDEDLIPRPSKMRYVAIFFAGLLVGRVASENFASGPLGAIDLFM